MSVTLELTLQERVRRFNLGTPTALHVGTHELVNDLWRTHEEMLSVLKTVEIVFDCETCRGAGTITTINDELDECPECHGNYSVSIALVRAAIAKATGA